MEKLFIHKLHEEVSLKRKVSATFYRPLAFENDGTWGDEVFAVQLYAVVNTLFAKFCNQQQLFIMLQTQLVWKHV